MCNGCMTESGAAGRMPRDPRSPEPRRSLPAVEAHPSNPRHADRAPDAARACHRRPSVRCPSPPGGSRKKGARAALRRAQQLHAQIHPRHRGGPCRRAHPASGGHGLAGPSPTATPTSARATTAATRPTTSPRTRAPGSCRSDPGKVVFAGWKSNCGGYQVWVSHGNGLYSAYYHLRSESVSKGQYGHARRRRPSAGSARPAARPGRTSTSRSGTATRGAAARTASTRGTTSTRGRTSRTATAERGRSRGLTRPSRARLRPRPAAAPRLHSPRARRADRREPRVHQLDRPDRPRRRAVRGRRRGPIPDRGDQRLPRLHGVQRRGLRRSSRALADGGPAGRLAGARRPRRPGLGDAATRSRSPRCRSSPRSTASRSRRGRRAAPLAVAGPRRRRRSPSWPARCRWGGGGLGSALLLRRARGARRPRSAASGPRWSSATGTS